MLSETEIKSILTEFPKFELSYETMSHKKVYADIMLAIPKGKKCFAWFTSYKEDNVCFLMDLNERNQITDMKIVITSFSDKMALGTIFYGTLFQYKKVNCFCIEDLYYYRGKSYGGTSYSDKLDLLSNILKKEMGQNVLGNNFTIFGLPIGNTDFNMLLKEIETLPYEVSQIKLRFFDKTNSKKIVTMNYFKPKGRTMTCQDSGLGKAVFKVTPDLEPDIYNLFIYKNGAEEFHDYAFIPDYKTSVMMNKLFRNIKENANLDALEESDDEAEFEDAREDKYVFLDRSFKMNCEYNSKFKRWTPIGLADRSDKLVNWSQLTMNTTKYNTNNHNTNNHNTNNHNINKNYKR
jgi:hypothetical protein